MDVLREILAWSLGRPEWQRDALRRLVQKGELDDADIDALTEICKSAEGLTSEQAIVQLGREHLPNGGENTGRVNVDSIYHKRGVNALAEDQTLKFGNGLTVVYGDNAAGKSGYVRIFKSACRARGTEDILGNVLSGTAPQSPIVSIKYTVGGEETQEWSRGDKDEALTRVSVFDRHSEAVYTTQKTDVAFRPFGLDLFDKLAQACAEVRERLEREQRSLRVSAIPALDLPENTTTAKFVARISSLTRPDEVKALVTLTNDESNRLNLIEKQLLDLQSNDPAKIEQELMLRSRRLRSFSQRLKKIDATLSLQAIKGAFEAQNQLLRKRDEARKLRETAIQSDHLPGTGLTDWIEMWEAGRRFSERNAYPEQSFPFTDNGALCVLCQQQLDQVTTGRLIRFEEFATSAAEREVRAASHVYEGLYRNIEDLILSDDGMDETINELRIEDENLAEAVDYTLSLAVERRTAIIETLANCKYFGEMAELPSKTNQVVTLADQLAVWADGLREGTSDSQKEALATELEELKARRSLQMHEEALLSEIERKRKLAAYGQCWNETDTRGITTKSTAVTKEVVTQQLKEAFKEELDLLNFRHVEVELKEAGGRSGNLYHKLILTRAPKVEMPKVVSEGESRCLSIAAFFAELSTADDPSAILFDDSVSSFDYRWRECVATRLAAEAKKRQVIVFTHDIVFLHLLHGFAEQESVEVLDQYVHQLGIGAGVCEDRLPWEASRVKERISYLNTELQKAEKQFKDGHFADYRKEVGHLYSLLRAAWERALEEVLLNEVVERFRPSIQTRRIGKITDISETDCKKIEEAMTKCSKLIPAHDHTPTAKHDVPEPKEIRQDIKELDTWAKSIRKRRGT